MNLHGPGCALVVIDMFGRFDFPGGPALARQARAVAPAVAALRDRFDRAGACVVHANDNFGHWDQDLDALVERCRRAGGTPAALARQLAPAPHHLRLLKPRHSALRGTALPLLLQQRRAGRLVLAGVAADACVLATAMEAHMLGFEVWVPSDAVASRTPALKAAALHLLRHGLRVPVTATARVAGLFPGA